MEYANNVIAMQRNFGQERNNNTLWDTTGDTNKMKDNLPRLSMVPYAILECLVQAKRTPNEFRLWMENQDKDDPKFQKEDWELLIFL